MRARLTPALLAAIAISAMVAALGQPRPAAASVLTYLAVSTVTGRRLALLACVAVVVGLVAASPTREPTSTPAIEQR